MEPLGVLTIRYPVVYGRVNEIVRNLRRAFMPFHLLDSPAEWKYGLLLRTLLFIFIFIFIIPFIILFFKINVMCL